MALFVDQIFAAGDDALNNEFQLTIPAFPGSIDVANTVIRVTSLSFPETSISTYAVDYKTQAFSKPAAKNKTPNSFSFDFRVDKYWKVYEGIENWLDIILNQSSGAMSPDIAVGGVSLIRVPIDIVPVDTNDVVTKKGWTMTGCFPSDLAGIEFTNTGDGTPITAKCTMQFIKKVRRT
jgi:hypothetical protein